MIIIIMFYLELGAYMQLSKTVPSANMSRSLPTTLRERKKTLKIEPQDVNCRAVW
jgi:hypothetical protein